MRILIADDSVVSRHLLEATLRKWGYEVVVATDGVEAWNVLQGENPPRLAILDWVMPGLTGPEVCSRVRETTKNKDLDYTYIVLLSSKSQREDLIEGLEAGADDYLTKPFDQHELKVRLRAGTRIIDLQRELVSAREELREQATKDFLTRIWNRSSILDVLTRELSRASREKRSVGVVLADLDRFKSVNDTYGHFAGDAVLREFTRRISARHAALRFHGPLRRRRVPDHPSGLRRAVHGQPGGAHAGGSRQRADDDRGRGARGHVQFRGDQLAAGRGFDRR